MGGRWEGMRKREEEGKRSEKFHRLPLFFGEEIKKALSFSLSIFTSSVWGKSEKVFCLIGYSSLFPKEILSDLFPFSFFSGGERARRVLHKFFLSCSLLPFPHFFFGGGEGGKKRRTFA